MKLGILVNKGKNLAHIVGLARAAVRKNHEVSVFVMDGGTQLLQEESLLELAKLAQVSVSFCTHSAELNGIDPDTIAKEIDCGSQLNNAMMNHDADRVVVL